MVDLITNPLVEKEASDSPKRQEVDIFEKIANNELVPPSSQVNMSGLPAAGLSVFAPSSIPAPLGKALTRPLDIGLDFSNLNVEPPAIEENTRVEAQLSRRLMGIDREIQTERNNLERINARRIKLLGDLHAYDGSSALMGAGLATTALQNFMGGWNREELERRKEETEEQLDTLLGISEQDAEALMGIRKERRDFINSIDVENPTEGTRKLVEAERKGYGDRAIGRAALFWQDFTPQEQKLYSQGKSSDRMNAKLNARAEREINTVFKFLNTKGATGAASYELAINSIELYGSAKLGIQSLSKESIDAARESDQKIAAFESNLRHTKKYINVLKKAKKLGINTTGRLFKGTFQYLTGTDAGLVNSALDLYARNVGYTKEQFDTIIELSGLSTTEVIKGLKQTFGSQLSDGERLAAFSAGNVVGNAPIDELISGLTEKMALQRSALTGLSPRFLGQYFAREDANLARVKADKQAQMQPQPAELGAMPEPAEKTSEDDDQDTMEEVAMLASGNNQPPSMNLEPKDLKTIDEQYKERDDLIESVFGGMQALGADLPVMYGPNRGLIGLPERTRNEGLPPEETQSDQEAFPVPVMSSPRFGLGAAIGLPQRTKKAGLPQGGSQDNPRYISWGDISTYKDLSYIGGFGAYWGNTSAADAQKMLTNSNQFFEPTSVPGEFKDKRTGQYYTLIRGENDEGLSVEAGQLFWQIMPELTAGIALIPITGGASMAAAAGRLGLTRVGRAITASAVKRGLTRVIGTGAAVGGIETGLSVTRGATRQALGGREFSTEEVRQDAVVAGGIGAAFPVVGSGFGKAARFLRLDKAGNKIAEATGLKKTADDAIKETEIEPEAGDTVQDLYKKELDGLKEGETPSMTAVPDTPETDAIMEGLVELQSDAIKKEYPKIMSALIEEHGAMQSHFINVGDMEAFRGQIFADAISMIEGSDLPPEAVESLKRLVNKNVDEIFLKTPTINQTLPIPNNDNKYNMLVRDTHNAVESLLDGRRINPQKSKGPEGFMKRYDSFKAQLKKKYTKNVEEELIKTEAAILKLADEWPIKNAIKAIDDNRAAIEDKIVEKINPQAIGKKYAIDRTMYASDLNEISVQMGGDLSNSLARLKDLENEMNEQAREVLKKIVGIPEKLAALRPLLALPRSKKIKQEMLSSDDLQDVLKFGERLAKNDFTYTELYNYITPVKDAATKFYTNSRIPEYNILKGIQNGIEDFLAAETVPWQRMNPITGRKEPAANLADMLNNTPIIGRDGSKRTMQDVLESRKLHEWDIRTMKELEGSLNASDANKLKTLLGMGKGVDQGKIGQDWNATLADIYVDTVSKVPSREAAEKTDLILNTVKKWASKYDITFNGKSLERNMALVIASKYIQNPKKFARYSTREIYANLLGETEATNVHNLARLLATSKTIDALTKEGNGLIDAGSQALAQIFGLRTAIGQTAGDAFKIGGTQASTADVLEQLVKISRAVPKDQREGIEKFVLNFAVDLEVKRAFILSEAIRAIKAKENADE